jgi:hypothetical protein
MKLTHFDEQNYQLELQVYRTTFPDFKYEPLSFIYMEIGINSRVLATPSMVQHIAITKPITPLRSRTCLEIIPLLIQTFHYLSQV